MTAILVPQHIACEPPIQYDVKFAEGRLRTIDNTYRVQPATAAS